MPNRSASPSVPARMTAADWLVLFGLSLLWGGSFFFSKVALSAFPPLTLVLGRVALAALALALSLRILGQSLPQGWRLWRELAVMGLLNNVIPFSLIFWGQTQIASALASILNATTPLFTALVLHVATRDERLTPGKIVGIAFGFAGVAVMIGPRLTEGALGAGLAGQVACLGAALSYGISGLQGRRFAGMGLRPLQTACGQLAASTLLLAPLVILVDRPWNLPLPALTPVLALVALALASTALAYVLFFRLMARAGATNASLVTFLIPVSAILLGVGLLGERLSLEEVLGMGLIGLGLAAIDGRAWQAWEALRRRSV